VTAPARQTTCATTGTSGAPAAHTVGKLADLAPAVHVCASSTGRSVLSASAGSQRRGWPALGVTTSECTTASVMTALPFDGPPLRAPAPARPAVLSRAIPPLRGPALRASTPGSASAPAMAIPHLRADPARLAGTCSTGTVPGRASSRTPGISRLRVRCMRPGGSSVAGVVADVPRTRPRNCLLGAGA
jgi:hypothetical protein